MSTGTATRPCQPGFDLGYFTNDVAPMLAFWRDELESRQRGAGALQRRPRAVPPCAGGSILKINTAAHGVATDVPSGFRELYIARADLDAPRTLHDPDGNPVTLVPSGYRGITGVGVRLAVPDISVEHRFFTQVMGFTATAPDAFTSGDTRLFLSHEPGLPRAGHWVNAGFRYVTLHVMRIDVEYADIVARGAEEGERPYDIGRVARISFVRDPFGNWFEVAQRAALAGPWWED